MVLQRVFVYLVDPECLRSSIFESWFHYTESLLLLNCKRLQAAIDTVWTLKWTDTDNILYSLYLSYIIEWRYPYTSYFDFLNILLSDFLILISSDFWNILLLYIVINREWMKHYYIISTCIARAYMFLEHCSIIQLMLLHSTELYE